MVILALDEPEFGGPGWAHWTLERELARRTAHTSWLATFEPSPGEERTYPWGRLVSTCDARSGGSEIVLRRGRTLAESGAEPESEHR